GFSLAANSHQTELSHLILAADHITGIFQTGGISYALIGGFSLQLRGSPPNTFDVHVAVGSSMRQLIELFILHPHVLCPLGPVSGVMRIWVRTGGDHNPGQGIRELDVGVDIILPGGSLGAPDNPQKPLKTSISKQFLDPESIRCLI
ncbi:uncharacterized protein K444DRAFT_714034, partial [Hyaloscypha bicolor E]